MNKNDLKNGMKFISRDGKIKYIIENNIYRKEYGNKLEFEYSLDTVKKFFEEDMSYEFNAKFDIMRIFDLEDNLIWEREEEMITSEKDLYKAFRTMCESHNRCDCCDYNYGVGTCEFNWILDNYNVTKKE